MSVPERRAWHLAEATVGPDESVASLLEDVARAHLNRGDAVRAIAEMSRAAELSPATADQGRRWAEAAYIGATVLGDMRNAPRLLDDVREMDPDHAGSLAGAVAAGYHLLNGDGDVDTAHRLLVGAIETAPDPSDASNEVLVEAIYNLLEVCFFGGRADLWPPFHRAMGRLEPHAPRFLELLAKTIPDPARDAVTVLDRLEEAIADLNHESSPTRITRIAVASSYIDRLPQCRTALWRVVHDGRAGGAVTMSIQALALLGFDAFLTGQWDSLAEMADEAVALCDTHSYGLLRWPSRSLQALLAAARGDSANARAIADEVTGWAVPRRAVAMHVYVLHARTLDAIGRGDFEDAYRNACAISPAGTIASHVPHAMWMVLDLVEAAMRTGRKDEAAAHVAAAQETGLPAISSRLASDHVWRGGDGRDRRPRRHRPCSSRRSTCRVRSSGRSIWLEYNSPSANGSAERGQQLAPVSCSPPHATRSSGSAPDHGRTSWQRAAGDRSHDRPDGPLRASVADAPTTGDRPARRRRADQQGDRRAAVPVPPHRRHPPLPALPQARNHLTRRIADALGDLPTER